MARVLDTKKSNFGTQEWLWLHIWFIMTLYDKVRQMLLENATAILFQNATVITKCDVYYKMRLCMQ